MGEDTERQRPGPKAERRVRIPFGPLGDLEVRHAGPAEGDGGHRIGALPYVTVRDYSGGSWEHETQTVWYVRNDKAKPGPYTAKPVREFPGPDNWAVLASSGAVAGCRMEGAAKYLGTEEQAREWAAKLNAKFGNE